MNEPQALEPQSGIFEVTALAAGLTRAQRGVVRVESAGGYATAWLITDSLVVVPGFFFAIGSEDADTVYRCYHHATGPEPLEATVVGRPNPKQVAGLLRLSQTLPGSALSLATGVPQPGDRIFIMQHYPQPNRLGVSMGQLKACLSHQLRYTAATALGSAGSPLLTVDWCVLGTHEQKRVQGKTQTNQGATLQAILHSLRKTDGWQEIAQFHQLASDTAQPGPKPTAKRVPTASAAVLLRAAVQWNFAPKSFSKTAQAALKPLVAMSSVPIWMLTAKERQRILTAGVTLRWSDYAGQFRALS